MNVGTLSWATVHALDHITLETGTRVLVNTGKNDGLLKESIVVGSFTFPTSSLTFPNEF